MGGDCGPRLLTVTHMGFWSFTKVTMRPLCTNRAAECKWFKMLHHGNYITVHGNYITVHGNYITVHEDIIWACKKIMFKKLPYSFGHE